MSSMKEGLRAVLPPRVVAGLKRAKLIALLQRERFGCAQRRTNALISVPGLVRRPTVKGAIWGVCLARNEEDIVAFTVRHMVSQGLAGVIVVDNMSTDATHRILDELAAEDPRIHVGIDEQAGFHQGGRVSYLAHLAWRAGADRVVPFDADEFWFAEGHSGAAFLAGLDANSAWCDFRNVFPTVGDQRIDLTAPTPVQVERKESAWLRVCFRARRWVWRCGVVPLSVV